MIKNTEALSIVEAVEFVKKAKIESTNLIGFSQKFTILKPKEAKELRKELQELGMLKIKSEHISKIIDLMPESIEDLNKIFVDISLDENESKKILEIIKKYK